MKTSEIRKDLHNYVDKADDASLKFFREAIIAYQAKIQKVTEVVKQPDLVAMTEDEFFAMIDEAENNIAKGKVYTQAEVEEKMRKRHASV